ncbi:hypothetical protein PR001_g16093 [Phytophthora rubi]|uniref:Uncharacterized protein n=1 Tax=Phytophthora rubi TaxID=129364 RepID=A0A6A3KLI6_9STRA|nr:hypothetical protein PR002_g16427 [Phytophthora rubi]KAE9010727.1 hypothetical protein PR001_g16093 [Phytophthora rubi]
MTMSNAATAESFGVRLKRKVLSAETKLFEWRPCSCTIVARDGKLLLQLQTPPQDEDSHSEQDNETETVTIDLATQLLNVVPKKNKARCDLEYYAPVATMSGQVLKEELMAPSATHCQQWIAQRVEAALRALELENAQAKTRERELVQEIQTLRDGARVAAAERKHIENEYRHSRREVDSWRRAAQSAEAAAAQLQEQLGIAREENQLLAGEKMRLKRQNSELLNQVHRLDSLVYGRF